MVFASAADNGNRVLLQLLRLRFEVIRHVRPRHLADPDRRLSDRFAYQPQKRVAPGREEGIEIRVAQVAAVDPVAGYGAVKHVRRCARIAGRAPFQRGHVPSGRLASDPSVGMRVRAVLLTMLSRRLASIPSFTHQALGKM